MGTRTAQGLSTYWAPLEPLVPKQIFDEVRSCRLDKTYKADVKRITLNTASPEKRPFVLEAFGQTDTAQGLTSSTQSHGTRVTDVSGRSPEDVKILVKAFLVEGGVQANSKAWHNAMQSENIQRKTIAHAQRPN